MNRHEIPAKNPVHQVFVGWDHPLLTFFVQVYDRIKLDDDVAETYDPVVLARLGVKGGIAPDVALAQTWYQKAKNLGSAVALERLERLARLPESPE